MSRTFTYPALVLKTAPSGESNRDAWFLTAGEGILRATVFGGPKSKLRAHVAPFHSGVVYLYRDPVRDSRKVSDFDVQNWRPGLRELYERAMAGDAVADTILASHGGGGNWETALSLANASLDALTEADEGATSRIFTHFLWNWADFLGLRPELDGNEPRGGHGGPEHRPCGASSDGLLWFDRLEGAFSTGPGNGFLPLGPGARRWLLAVQDLHPVQLARVSADPASLAQARTVVTALMADILGRELSTWRF
ncbi:MAG: recombination protein O N-terminal domain-containing protein [Treponema sp.]|jgi:DNA repair protein RecO (recombination protein O)|nr:recombination protein O N-terminal domain-containing protein [Treponema sp.]